MCIRDRGYTKGELIRHYLSMPVIVTFLAAVVGNIPVSYTHLDVYKRQYEHSAES